MYTYNVVHIEGSPKKNGRERCIKGSLFAFPLEVSSAWIDEVKLSIPISVQSL